MIEEIKPETEPVVETKPVENPPKYRAEVAGIGENKWSGNALEYDTEEEAKKYLDSLSMRWFGYDLGRVVPVSVPRNQEVNMKEDTFYQNFRKSRNPLEENPPGVWDYPSPPSGYDDYPKEWDDDAKCSSCGFEGTVGDFIMNDHFERNQIEKIICPKCKMVDTMVSENPLPNRHYTPIQRKAIMKTPQFLDWKRTHIKTMGRDEPEQGWFHAFMTDVGKDADLKGVGRFPDSTRRSDMRGVDVTPKRKYYHRLPRKPRSNPPTCPNCKIVVLESIDTNPPGGKQCPKCQKVFMSKPVENPKGGFFIPKQEKVPSGWVLDEKMSDKTIVCFIKDGWYSSVSGLLNLQSKEMSYHWFIKNLKTEKFNYGESESYNDAIQKIETLKPNDNPPETVANPPEKKDMLVTYKGGGYDGCFWEWNFFIYDDEGKFVDIGSSGRNGITDEKTAEEYLKNEENRRGKDYFITDLNDPESVKEFVDETNEGNVLNVITEVNKHYGDEKMQFKCPECGQMATEGENTGYHGDGGVGITKTGLLCQECYLGHTCGYCGEYHSDQSELDIDDDSHCTYCKPDTEENPKQNPYLNTMIVYCRDCKDSWGGYQGNDMTMVEQIANEHMTKTGHKPIVGRLFDTQGSLPKFNPPEENPSKATLLKKEAMETATWRGHDMSNFTKRDRDFESTCKKCGMQMWVTPKPAPNEIDIVGEAVALGCGEKENPPADKHFVTGVNKETGKRHMVSRFMSLEECKEFINEEPPNGGKGVWDKMRIKNWKTGEEVWSE